MSRQVQWALIGWSSVSTQTNHQISVCLTSRGTARKMHIQTIWSKNVLSMQKGKNYYITKLCHLNVFHFLIENANVWLDMAH